MRLLSALLILLMLSGCPLFLERKFPNTPDDLMIIPPAELKQIPHGSSASTILDAAMENNSTYFIIADQVQGWQEWYIEQKAIFESVK